MRSPSPTKVYSAPESERSFHAVPTAVGGDAHGKEGTNMADKKVVYRDSKTGEFTTERYADRHPATTERQHVPVKAPKK